MGEISESQSAKLRPKFWNQMSMLSKENQVPCLNNTTGNCNNLVTSLLVSVNALGILWYLKEDLRLHIQATS